MYSLTVEEISSSLGLKDESYKRMIRDAVLMRKLVEKGGPVSAALARPVAEWDRMYRVIETWGTLGHTTELYGVLTEFSNTYLPKVLLAHHLALKDEIDNVWTRALGNLATLPIFGRFIRGPKGGEFLESLYAGISAHMPLLDSLPLKDSSGRKIGQLSALCTTITLSLIHRSKGKPLPPTSTPAGLLFSHQLRTLLVRLRRDRPSINPSQRIFLRNLDDLLTMEWSTLGLLEGTLQEERMESLTGLVGWFDCGGKRLGQDPRSSCRRLNEDDLACGRCLAVRYCCREHQRASWKEHKKLCLAPMW